MQTQMCTVKKLAQIIVLGQIKKIENKSVALFDNDYDVCIIL